MQGSFKTLCIAGFDIVAKRRQFMYGGIQRLVRPVQRMIPCGVINMSTRTS